MHTGAPVCILADAASIWALIICIAFISDRRFHGMPCLEIVNRSRLMFRDVAGLVMRIIFSFV